MGTFWFKGLSTKSPKLELNQALNYFSHYKNYGKIKYYINFHKRYRIVQDKNKSINGLVERIPDCSVKEC